MLCKANDCPLEAEFVTNWEQDDSGRQRPKWGVCWYHRQAPPEHWGRTTDRIKQNIHAVVAARSLSRNIDPLTRHEPGETVVAYLDRVSSSLDRIVLGDIEPQDAAANFQKIIELLR